MVLMVLILRQNLAATNLKAVRDHASGTKLKKRQLQLALLNPRFTLSILKRRRSNRLSMLKVAKYYVWPGTTTSTTSLRLELPTLLSEFGTSRTMATRY